MDKQIVTISVGKNITTEEINEIRKIFKQNEKHKNCILNIIVSGNDDFKENIKNFIKAGINS